MLQTDQTTSDQSAIWISVKRKTAVMLGCHRDIEHELDREQIADIDVVSVLIRTFLESEKAHRFLQVDQVVEALQKAVVSYNGGLVDPGSSETLITVTSTGSDKLIKLYLQLCNVKAIITAWRTQLVGFRRHAAELGTDNAESGESMGEYVDSLISEYDMEINKCEMSLHGTSLVFQVVRISPLATSHVVS